MSVGLSYRTWGVASAAEIKVPAMPLRARATAGEAMFVVSFFDAVLLVVVVAAMGLSLSAW